jgi:hypothetical protein
MASGIKVEDACVDKFQELKLGKAHRYVLYMINADNRSCCIDCPGFDRRRQRRR